MFIGPHRAAFLEFLRNLSPQIMLLAIAFVASARLDLHHVAWSVTGIGNVLPFAFILIVFFGAMIANITLFLDKIGEKSEKVQDALEKARTSVRLQVFPGTHARLLAALVAAIWRHDKAGVARFVAAFLVVEIGLVGLVLAALPSAISLMNLVHPQPQAAPTACPASQPTGRSKR